MEMQTKNMQYQDAISLVYPVIFHVAFFSHKVAVYTCLLFIIAGKTRSIFISQVCL